MAAPAAATAAVVGSVAAMDLEEAAKAVAVSMGAGLVSVAVARAVSAATEAAASVAAGPNRAGTVVLRVAIVEVVGARSLRRRCSQ